MPVMHSRVLVGVAAATLLVAAAPSVALGATVSHAGGAARLDFLASSGEANRVTVSSSGGQIVVTDRGVTNLQEQGDCTVDSADPQVVSCPAAGITALELSGGNLDDELINTTALGAQAYGEDGPDFVQGGGGGERLEGGPGIDRINGGGGNDRLYGATLQAPGAGATPTGSPAAPATTGCLATAALTTSTAGRTPTSSSAPPAPME